MNHLEIIQKLIGEIRPVGETNTDNERFENLKTMCALAYDIIEEISMVHILYDDRQEHSVKRASEYAGKFLKETLEIKLA